MVSLKDYLSILRSPTACTGGFELGCKCTKINTLGVQPFDNGGGFAPFSHLSTYRYYLLLHAYCSADTEILGKTAYSADFSHEWKFGPPRRCRTRGLSEKALFSVWVSPRSLDFGSVKLAMFGGSERTLGSILRLPLGLASFEMILV